MTINHLLKKLNQISNHRPLRVEVGDTLYTLFIHKCLEKSVKEFNFIARLYIMQYIIYYV